MYETLQEKVSFKIKVYCLAEFIDSLLVVSRSTGN